ncbi:MAG: AAA family ATPase [Opitutaceae bacterium]|jgi:HTH-type transcriptional repressor of NAD biosynthesis genes|nr:AAA family ATPase [Opitutaceae bacterium]
MSARFRTGLVVGKFCPLHRGHEYVLNHARARCEEVVVISYTRPELAGCEPERREAWLAACCPWARRLVVTPERLRAWWGATGGPVELPENSEPDDVHRQFVGRLCLEVLRCEVDAVFTSEAYGEGFAAELTRLFPSRRSGHAPPVVHVAVDPARAAVPVSGEALRRDPHGLRHFLSPAVYASFVRRVALLGGESTGKSTLALALAERLGTVAVPEYGRERWQARGGRLVYEDLLEIAREHVAREEAAALRAVRFLICDTTPLTTLFYSRHLFGRAEPELERLAQRAYDPVVLCAADFPFVQDGTRSEETLRDLQQSWYRAELVRRGVAHTEVRGGVEERIDTLHKAGVLS